MGEPESGLTKRGNAGMDMMPEVMSVDTFEGLVAGALGHRLQRHAHGAVGVFLKNAGVFDDWVGDCPLSYTSPNAPTNRDILGTWMLSVLAGHRRYAHVTALRGDGVSPQVLGMRRIVSRAGSSTGRTDRWIRWERD